jgi:signal peptidase
MDEIIEKPKKKLWRRILGWVIYLAILVALVWGTPKALSKYLDTDFPIAAITSGSMWPTLKTGDMVLIRGVHGKNDIKIGDVVVYKNPSTSSGQAEFTIHRVVKMTDTKFTTKGDANDVEDTPVGYDKLVGRTVTVGGNPLRIPYLGNISIMLNGSKT